MAKRRMFSLAVVDTDIFLDLPSSSQALYFHLGMRADDDGFVASPKRITSTVGSSPDDLKLLITKGFVIPFDSGVCVIKDWRINNMIRPDRYTPTIYKAEKALLTAPENGIPNVIPNDIPSVTTGKVSIGKDRIVKKREGTAGKPPRSRFVPPAVEEVAEYCRERGNGIDAERFVDYYTARGWIIGKGKMKDWRAAVRTWERNEDNGRCNSSAGADDTEERIAGAKYII